MEYYSKLSLVIHYWWSNSELRLVWSLIDDHVLPCIYDIKSAHKYVLVNIVLDRPIMRILHGL